MNDNRRLTNRVYSGRGAKAARYYGDLRLPAFGVLLLLSLCSPSFCATPPVTCPAGAPIGKVDLRVSTPGTGNPLPLRTINRLTEGDTILYAPILRTGEKRPGEVALVLVPAIPASKDETIVVLDPKPAAKPAQWKVSRKISVVAFVYGPDGLSRAKVEHFLAKENDLVSQLADYAEKTTQTEELITSLTQSDSSPVTMNAALQGFASQYGLSGKLDKTLPADQQAMALFRTVNPVMDSSDPLASESSQRVGQTASIATSIAGLFFGSPVGLAAGGTAMVMEMKMLAFPRTTFRSSLAEKLPNDGMALCAKKTPAGPHTKIAYLWAARIPNIAPPAITIGNANSLPVLQKSPMPVTVADADWKYIDRVRNWQLTSDGKPIPVLVKKAGDDKTLEVDLTKAKVPPGTYKLTADWDWNPFVINGELHVQKIGDFGGARLDPLSQDQLIAGKGKIRASLTEDDFEFVTGVQFKRVNDEFSKPAAVPYVLSEGVRRGPQKHLDLLVDTKDLDSGKYQFLITQVDGRTHPVAFDVLPSPPTLANLPIVISRSDETRKVTLKGEHLDLLTRLEAAHASIALGPALPSQSERIATIQVKPDLKPGSAFDVNAFVQGHSEPVRFENAIHIVGPRPVITGAKLSPPSTVSIPLQPGELAAGVFVNGMIDISNLDKSSSLQLSCAGQEGTVVGLRMGEHSNTASLQRMAADQIFLSFDTSGWPTGCTIEARIDNGPDGLSEPVTLGRLVRFPHVESFQIVSSESGTADLAAELTGTDLQNIEKVGWEAGNSAQVTDLPSPIPGAGMKQSLRVKLAGAAPLPHSPLYLWLRGDKEGRLTSIRE